MKYILLLLSLLSFLTILRRGRWENVKKTWKNEIYLVVVVIVDYFWKFYGGAAAGGRLLRKLGKIRYIWDFVVLDYFCCNFRKLSFRRTFFCKCSFWTLVYNFSFQHLMYLIGGRLFKKLDEIVDFFGNRGWSIFFTKKQQKISYFDYFQGNLWFL